MGHRSLKILTVRSSLIIDPGHFVPGLLHPAELPMSLSSWESNRADARIRQAL